MGILEESVVRAMEDVELTDNLNIIIEEMRSRSFTKGVELTYSTMKEVKEAQNPPTKTPQEQRDEIVGRAKADIDDLRTTIIDGQNVYLVEHYGCYADFIVNKEKQTVVVLLNGMSMKKIYSKGIAKCAPNDCFNVHIGKAIALRRALGLDVPSEYLNAPQPTEVRVGDYVSVMDVSTRIPKIYCVSDNRDDDLMPGSRFVTSNVVLPEEVIDDSREGGAE